MVAGLMRLRTMVYMMGLLALAVVVGGSLEFRRLDLERARERALRFSPAEYARDLWDNRLPSVLQDAQPADQLIRLFNKDMQAAVTRGRTLGYSRVHAYLLSGRGRIAAVQNDGMLLDVLQEDPDPEVFLCVGQYISSNAIRDASGLVDVSAFSDTMKFNRISAEINRIVVQEVIRPFLDRAPQVGATVDFVGAAEVAEDATAKVPFGGRQQADGTQDSWHLLKVVPVRLELVSVTQQERQ